MEVDPGIIIAVVAGIASAYTVWRTSRKEERAARIVADTEGVKVVAEFDVRREELLSAGIEAHFNRLEEQVARAEERIDQLTARVDQLEHERERMLAWMAFNRLGWPPPEDFVASIGG